MKILFNFLIFLSVLLLPLVGCEEHFLDSSFTENETKATDNVKISDNEATDSEEISPSKDQAITTKKDPATTTAKSKTVVLAKRTEESRIGGAKPNKSVVLGEKAYLQENKKKKGIITLPSGLQYFVIKKGKEKGQTPGPNSTVSVHFRAFRLNTSEFDTSYMHKKAPSFIVNTVIDGWSEALQRMTVGAKWKIFVPPELGYGNAGSLGLSFGSVPLLNLTNIEKNRKAYREKITKEKAPYFEANVYIGRDETLIYEIELISIDS